MTDGFDWVSARLTWTAEIAVEALAEEAERNIDVFRRKGGFPAKSVYFQRSGLGFRVWRERGRSVSVVHHRGAVVSQSLPEGDAATSCVAEPVVGADHTPRLLVDGAELAPWQFLQRVLTPVLFVSPWE